MAEAVCNCGPGVWGDCSECGRGGVLYHACPGGCDDVTCEDVYLCGICVGSPCPVHHTDDEKD